jgi:2-oxoglutarate ferredoxin oxidoreductase subunit alpha
MLLRAKYLVDVKSVTKVKGVSFLADEIGRFIRAALAGRLNELEQDKTIIARLSAAHVEAGVSA